MLPRNVLRIGRERMSCRRLHHTTRRLPRTRPRSSYLERHRSRHLLRRPQMESHLPYRRQRQRGRPKERRVHPRKFKKQVSMINSCPPPRACAKRGAGRNKRSPRSVSVSHLTHVRVTVNDGRTYQAPTKKELLEARRETARMRSDMRVSISTDATRSLDIKTLLERFDVSSVSLYILRCRVGTHVEPLQKATRTRGATTAATLVGF